MTSPELSLTNPSLFAPEEVERLVSEIHQVATALEERGYITMTEAEKVSGLASLHFSKAYQALLHADMETARDSLADALTEELPLMHYLERHFLHAIRKLSAIAWQPRTEQEKEDTYMVLKAIGDITRDWKGLTSLKKRATLWLSEEASRRLEDDFVQASHTRLDKEKEKQKTS